jgi:hypothetical protein
VDGNGDGAEVGLLVGRCVGSIVVGAELGDWEGTQVDGNDDGAEVGGTVGTGDGKGVGPMVGA